MTKKYKFFIEGKPVKKLLTAKQYCHFTYLMDRYKLTCEEAYKSIIESSYKGSQHTKYTINGTSVRELLNDTEYRKFISLIKKMSVQDAYSQILFYRENPRHLNTKHYINNIPVVSLLNDHAYQIFKRYISVNKSSADEAFDHTIKVINTERKRLGFKPLTRNNVLKGALRKGKKVKRSKALNEGILKEYLAKKYDVENNPKLSECFNLALSYSYATGNRQQIEKYFKELVCLIK